MDPRYCFPFRTYTAVLPRLLCESCQDWLEKYVALVLEEIEESQEELGFSKLWLVVWNWFPKFEAFYFVTGWLSNLISHLESNRQKHLFRGILCFFSYGWKGRALQADLQMSIRPEVRHVRVANHWLDYGHRASQKCSEILRSPRGSEFRPEPS